MGQEPLGLHEQAAAADVDRVGLDQLVHGLERHLERRSHAGLRPASRRGAGDRRVGRPLLLGVGAEHRLGILPISRAHRNER